MTNLTPKDNCKRLAQTEINEVNKLEYKKYKIFSGSNRKTWNVQEKTEKKSIIHENHLIC